jgi:predicted enzyme related to lactoylglutathione lyase
VTDTAHKPVWIDMSSSDPEGSRAFYSSLFGWDIQVNPDPQYGGYSIAKLDGKDVAGIGPAFDPSAPTAWSIYIGTDDTEALGAAVTAAGGTVVMAGMEVGDQGRMAVFQDPAGAFISSWQPRAMSGFGANAAGAYGWAELTARGFERAIPFYETVFGWTHRMSDMPDGGRYTEFLASDTSVAGGMEMPPMVPADVPSYWMPYFLAADVDAIHAQALAAGAREIVPVHDMPDGRFSILTDPQGALFGLIKMS